MLAILIVAVRFSVVRFSVKLAKLHNPTFKEIHFQIYWNSVARATAVSLQGYFYHLEPKWGLLMSPA